MKEYDIISLSPNGFIEPCATFGSLEKAQEVVKELQQQRPYMAYFIEEREY